MGIEWGCDYNTTGFRDCVKIQLYELLNAKTISKLLKTSLHIVCINQRIYLTYCELKGFSNFYN